MTVKLTFCLRRRPDLSLEEFQRYWLETHGPLVRERAVAMGVRRYVQAHTLDLPGLHDAYRRRNDGCPEPFDGVAELWFDDLSALGGGEGAKQAAAELLADERNFIDLSRSPMWMSEEHELYPGT
ncbi:MAG: EthD domain-containing protein [Actinomycetota bacterium]|nr:EthD domain-containing protein [Actinomycetota bacterium]